VELKEWLDKISESENESFLKMSNFLHKTYLQGGKIFGLYQTLKCCWTVSVPPHYGHAHA